MERRGFEQMLKTLKNPFILYFVCCASLFGRFFPLSKSYGDSIPAPEIYMAWSGFVFSTFLFTLIYVVICVAWKSFFISRLVRLLVIGLILLLVFPYNLVGLDAYYVFKYQSPYTEISSSTSEKLVEGLRTGNLETFFPNKLTLFLLLTLILIGIGFLSKAVSLKLSLLMTGVLILQTWQNVSFGSVFSWAPSLEKPLNENYTYVFAAIEPQSALISADEHVHSSLTIFFNTGYLMHSTLFQRGFPYYLVSQFSYFVHPFYVWVVLNSIFWFVAALAVRKISLQLNLSEASANVGAFIFLINPYAISVVGQSSGYMWSIVAPIFYLALVQGLHRNIHDKALQFILHIALGTCFLLSYSFVPWFAAFLVIFRLLGFISTRKAFLIFFFSAALYIIYTRLLTLLFEISLVETVDKLMLDPLFNVYSDVVARDFGKITFEFANAIEKLASAPLYLLFPHVYLLLILVLIKSLSHKNLIQKSVQLVATPLIFTSLLIASYFGIGSGWLQTVPRIYSPATIGLILLIASAINFFQGRVPRQSILLVFACLVVGLSFNLRTIPGWREFYFQLMNGFP